MKGNKFAAAAAFFLLTLAAMLTVVDVLCFDRGVYTKEYAKNGTAEYMQMSDEDLEHTTDVLLAYLKDERDDLYVKAVVDGTEREVFDQREKLHMIDVKALYQNAMTFRTAAAVIGAVLLCAVLYGHEKKRELLKFGFQAASFSFSHSYPRLPYGQRSISMPSGSSSMKYSLTTICTCLIRVRNC